MLLHSWTEFDLLISLVEHQASRDNNNTKGSYDTQKIALIGCSAGIGTCSGNLAHGGNTNKINKKRRGRMTDNCPTQPVIQEDTEFPETVKVHIPLAQAESMNRMPHDVKNRSLSPWDYSVKEDPNRFPHIISEASCRYTVCLDSTGEESKLCYELCSYSAGDLGSETQTYWLQAKLLVGETGDHCWMHLCLSYFKRLSEKGFLI